MIKQQLSSGGQTAPEPTGTTFTDLKQIGIAQEENRRKTRPTAAEQPGGIAVAKPGEDDGEAEPPVAEPPAVDAKTVFLAGLFIIAVATVLYFAQAVFLPIVLAVILKLLFQPAMRQAERIHIPRVISALLATTALVVVLAVIFAALSGSAGAWFTQLPQGMARLQEKFSFLQTPANLLRELSASLDQVLGGTTGAPTGAEPAHHLSLPEALLTGTRAVLDTSLSTLLLLFFLLAVGDTFLRRLVEVLPRFRDKRQAVDISLQIERDIGSYLATISVMNFLVGSAMALGTYLCGLKDPILWGVVAFILNFVPILGPISGSVLFAFVGFLTFDDGLLACMPALIYIGIHILEGEVITPLLLARRFTLNPALIMMSLIFWYWMWGVTGAFLAVPLLAITKIICVRFRPLMAFGHFLGN